jgi:hypothetical protein
MRRVADMDDKQLTTTAILSGGTMARNHRPT